MAQKTSKLVSVLGALGYLSLTMQWLWLVVTLLPWFMSLEIMTTPRTTPVVNHGNGDFSWFSLLIALAVLVVVVGLTVYVVAKLPGYIAHESSRVVHAAQDIILPSILRDKKVSKRKKIQISSRVLFSTKLIVSILPYLGLYGAIMTHPPLSDVIILTIGWFLLGWSLLCIIAQRIIAHCKKIDYSLSF